MQDLELQLNEPGGRVLELALVGEIDMATVAPVRQAAEDAAASKRFDWLLFDLSGVTFIDSNGLHVLFDAQRAMSARGGGVKLVCGRSHVRAVLELTGLSELAPVYDGKVDALALHG